VKVVALDDVAKSCVSVQTMQCIQSEVTTQTAQPDVKQCCDAEVDTAELQAMLSSHCNYPSPSMLDRLASSPSCQIPYDSRHRTTSTHSAQTQTTPRQSSRENLETAQQNSMRPPLPPAASMIGSFEGVSSMQRNTTPFPPCSAFSTQPGHREPYPMYRDPSDVRQLGAPLPDRFSMQPPPVRADIYERQLGHPDFGMLAGAVQRHPIRRSASAPTLPPVPPPAGVSSAWALAAAPPQIPHTARSSCASTTPQPMYAHRDVLGHPPCLHAPAFQQVDAGCSSSQGGSSTVLRDNEMLMRAYEVYRQQQLDLMRN